MRAGAETASVQSFRLSAKSAEALLVAASDLAECGFEGQMPPLADIATPCNRGPPKPPFRMDRRAEGIPPARKLPCALPPKSTRGAAARTPVAFRFPAKEHSFPGMCAGLYGVEPHLYRVDGSRGQAALGGRSILDLLALLTTAG